MKINKIIITLGFCLFSYIAYGCMNTTDEERVSCTVTTNKDEIEVIYIPSGLYDESTHKVLVDSKDFIQ